MSKMLVLFFVSFSFVSHQAAADIFGKDDRRNPRRGSVQHKLSKSVAVGVLTSLIDNNKVRGIDLYTEPLSKFMCKDERFVEQPSLAYACTGFLVGPDLLMTAGHCASNHSEVIDSSEGYCEAYSWLFDYVQTSKGKVKTKKVSTDNLYKCKRIVYAVLKEEGDQKDFALIQLDRPVTKRSYLKLAKSAAKVGDPVTMIGAPLGLPLKFTSNAKVLKNDVKAATFSTNLDAFQGNSGSPVFNSKNEVLGILVGGTPNAVTYTDEKLQCERYNFCDQDGKNCKESEDWVTENGSDVEKLFKYKDIINEHIDFSKARSSRFHL